jgi:hypothetical protein
VSGFVIVGYNNVVNKQTIIQKFFNIFKSDSETLEHRNRRILLGHVENAWIKGVLDASLHGAALLDLGIKQDPEAVTKYPWAIQKESTKETLPAGTFMLDIFDSIGMGRSLLILGAPGSGKTTMLLELARGLIARAREDVTQPIPMVFNLSSWTESKTLVDWLAQELNNLYSVPRKTAPDWVKGDKLLLLLDGLDEVRQESRAKCVEAINAFRKEYGLTSLAVCSRSQDYAAIKAKLSFEGAIEVQPLTQEQITKFFNRFGDEMAGIKQALEKDSALREMAETPLFLSIMIMAYRDKRDVDIWVSKDEKSQRKLLFDTYIECMFKSSKAKNSKHQNQKVLRWLSCLSVKMIKNNQVPLLIENIHPGWFENSKQKQFYRFYLIAFMIFLQGFWTPISLFFSDHFTLISIWKTFLDFIFFTTWSGICAFLFFIVFKVKKSEVAVAKTKEKSHLYLNFISFINSFRQPNQKWLKFPKKQVDIKKNHKENRIKDELLDPILEIVDSNVEPVGKIRLAWQAIRMAILFSVFLGALIAFIVDSIQIANTGFVNNWFPNTVLDLAYGGFFGLICTGPFVLLLGFTRPATSSLIGLQVSATTKPNEGIRLSFFYWIVIWLSIACTTYFYSILIWAILLNIPGETNSGMNLAEINSLLIGASINIGLLIGILLGGFAVIQHYTLRFILARNNLLPWRLVSFLNHCVDLIFLRRVGGGYIFVHRLLMEHFAEMYLETPTSKGN